MKCVKYWPNRNDLLSFGSISVKLIEEKIYAFFIERKHSVTNSVVCSYKNYLFIVLHKVFQRFWKEIYSKIDSYPPQKKRIYLCCSSACSIFRFKIISYIITQKGTQKGTNWCKRNCKVIMTYKKISKFMIHLSKILSLFFR